MAATLGVLPERIVSGESIWISAANTVQDSSDIDIPDFSPADGYTLAYQFASATPASVSAAASGDNTKWTLDVPAATTLTWKAGTIRFVALATKAGKSYAVDSGTVGVDPSPLATSSWTAVVTACDAAILTYAGNPNGSFTVDGIMFSYRSMSQLTELRAYAKNMADYETGNRMPRTVRKWFT